MVPRLFELAGKAPPNNILDRGQLNKPESGIHMGDRVVNPPMVRPVPVKDENGNVVGHQANTGNPANAAYNPQSPLNWNAAGGPSELGTWYHDRDGGGWVRVQ
jgi:hypothetical protein